MISQPAGMEWYLVFRHKKGLQVSQFIPDPSPVGRICALLLPSPRREPSVPALFSVTFMDLQDAACQP